MTQISFQEAVREKLRLVMKFSIPPWSLVIMAIRRLDLMIHRPPFQVFNRVTVEQLPR